MQSRLDPELLKAYLQTDYIVSDDPPMMLKIGEQSDDARIFLKSFNTDFVREKSGDIVGRLSLQLGDRNRRPNQIALNFVASEFDQCSERIDSLNAFSNDIHIQGSSQANDRPDDFVTILAVLKALHKRPVNLDRVERKAAEISERGVAGAEII